VLDPVAAAELAAQLEDVGLPASLRIRRDRGVVTWKSGDRVGTFLRGIGGGSALLELEVRQVSRSMRGDLNRVINAESANLQRAVMAAGRQLEAIDAVEAAGLLQSQPTLVRLVAAARRETPEATLAELAQRLELTRSTVQRALERIDRLALAPASDLEDSGMMGRRCAPSSSPRTGRCTRRRATRVSSRR
jgi:DNA-binding protein WhiA